VELAAAGLLPAVCAHIAAVAGASFPGLRAAAARSAGHALAAAGGAAGAAAAPALTAAFIPALPALLVKLLADPAADVRSAAIGAVRRAARHGLPAAQAAAAAAPALLPALLGFVTRDSPNTALRLKVDGALRYLLGARDPLLKGPPQALAELCGDAAMQKFVKTYWAGVLRAGAGADAAQESDSEEEQGGE
jgi:hypothetical protein